MATRKAETDKVVLFGVLITLLDVEALKIFDTFVIAMAGDEKKIKPVLDKFNANFEPLKSEVLSDLSFCFAISNQVSHLSRGGVSQRHSKRM